MSTTVPDVRWNNLGVSRHMSGICVKTPFGNLLIKKWADRLFSERYGYRKCLRVSSWCVTWARLRKSAE